MQTIVFKAFLILHTCRIIQQLYTSHISLEHLLIVIICCHSTNVLISQIEEW